MRLTASLVCILSLLSTTSLSAEFATPTDHSIVNIVFVAPISAANQMLGGMGGQAPTARVGDFVVPIDQIAPISISIDNEFVGHAMVGFANITPTFVLESGTHEFSFSCEGYKSVSQKLKVIGTGSKQYLLIQMQKESSHDQANDANGHSSKPAALEIGVTNR